MASKKVAQKKTANSDLIYIGIGALLLFITLIQTFLLTGSVFSERVVPLNDDTLYTVFVCFGILSLFMIYLLVINRRFVIGILSIIFTLTVTLGGYVLMMQHANFFPYLNSAKNIIYSLSLLYLVLYGISHVVIHGLAWINDKKRQIITRRGLINYGVVIVVVVVLNEIIKNVIEITH